MLKQLTVTFALVDVWHRLHNDLNGFSFYRNNVGSRIDSFYVSPDLIHKNCNIVLQPTIISDHLGLHFSFPMLGTKHLVPSFLWHLNQSILDLESYQQEIQILSADFYMQLQSLSSSSTFLFLWLQLKRKIMYLSKTVSKEQATTKRQQENYYYSLLREGYKQLSQGRPVYANTKRVKAFLLRLHTEEKLGLAFRSRECNSHVFLSITHTHVQQELKRAKDNFFNSFILNDGTVLAGKTFIRSSQTTTNSILSM